MTCNTTSMLLLLIAAAQQVPTINVTVQQPPGLPVWVTALISAAIGAAFALTTNVLMEYVKPWITKRRTRQSVAKQITDEVATNMRVLEASLLVLKDIGNAGGPNQTTRQREQAVYLMGIVDFLRSTAYDHCLKQEVSTMIALDTQSFLRTFYSSCSLARSLRSAQQIHPQFEETMRYALDTGRAYLKDKGVPYNREGFPVAWVENDLKKWQTGPQIPSDDGDPKSASC